ncbi:hypothetical protein RUND412_006104, partial [Rhizina undulata]
CLSLTNQYFWNIGQRHIKAIYAMLFLGIWAGTSIARIGDYANDYPTGLLTEADEEELQEGYRYQEVQVGNRLPSMAFRIEPVFDEYLKLPSTVGNQYRALTDPEFSMFYPGNRHWILRNLTTREYVRSESIALKPEYIHGPKIDFLGFGQVVLSRICWSSDPSVSMAAKVRSTVEYGLEIISTLRLLKRWGRARMGRRNGRTLVRKLQRSWRQYGRANMGTIPRMVLEPYTDGETEWKDVGEEDAKELYARVNMGTIGGSLFVKSNNTTPVTVEDDTRTPFKPFKFFLKNKRRDNIVSIRNSTTYF